VGRAVDHAMALPPKKAKAKKAKAGGAKKTAAKKGK
jgi:hypothetical protein